MLMGVIFLTISTCLAKLVFMNNTKMNSIDYLLIRSSVIVVASTLETAYQGVNIFHVPRRGRLFLSLRCLFGVIAMPSYYMGLKYLPASKAALIRNMYPLLVTLTGFCILGERITRYDIIATFGAFFGAIIMNLNSTYSIWSSINDSEATLGIILCSVTAILSVGVAIFIRLMNRHLHYL